MGIKSLAFLALASGGAPRVIHGMLGRGRASVLMYHGIVRDPLAVGDWCFVGEADFGKQIKYLARHFEVVALADLPERLQRPAPQRPLAAITFDDGYESNYALAWPVLRKYGLPATIFLNTALVGGDDTVWFCRLNDALARSVRREIGWQGRPVSIATAGEKAAAGDFLQESLKKLAPEKMAAECDRIIRELGAMPGRPVEPGSPYRMLAPAQVAEMARGGLIEFGAHTRTHAILAPLPDERLREEIEGSIDDVEAITGRPCRTFAYPNGRDGDFDRRAIDLLRQRGISAAVTTIGGPNMRATPPLELRRYGIGAGMPWSDFLLEIHHVKNWLRGR
ncbi:MAG: polysaccharide deacetylase family protein [Candidatus Sumerlaeia bacterium]